MRFHTGWWASPLALALLTACPYIGDDAAFDRFDVDGDGHAWPDDCDESDPTVNPAAEERCDGVDNDCDGIIDGANAIDPTAWYNDLDGDGHGDPDDDTLACDLPEGWSATADDCDDADPDVSPSESEVCNDGVDNDCDADPMQCALLGDVLAPIPRSFTLPNGVSPMSPLAIAGGDFNGDGLDDIAVGDPNNSQVLVFLAPFTASPLSVSQIVMGFQSSRFGFALRAGDLDHDGVDELVVGAPNRSALTLGGEITNAGAVYVLRGAPWLEGGSYDAAPAALVYGTQSYEQLGRTIAIAKGAPSRVVIGSERGIFLEDLERTARGHIGYDGDIGCPMGDAVAALDVDGDGVDEVLGASMGCGSLVGSPGRVFLYPGDLIGQHAEEQALAQITGATANAAFGFALGDHSDLDGDGRDEVVIGAPHTLVGDARVGAVYVFREPPSGALSVDNTTEQALGPANGALFGFSLAVADLNGDGAGELLVGVPGQAEGSNIISGWYGAEPLTARAPDVRLHPDAGTHTAAVLVRLGDVNGDGLEDVASLDPHDDGSLATVRVILGSGQ